VELLSEELRALIRALPPPLQESVPEQIKLDTGIAGNENETPRRGE
jgi:hypothetical protein